MSPPYPKKHKIKLGWWFSSYMFKCVSYIFPCLAKPNQITVIVETTNQQVLLVANLQYPLWFSQLLFIWRPPINFMLVLNGLLVKIHRMNAHWILSCAFLDTSIYPNMILSYDMWINIPAPWHPAADGQIRNHHQQPPTSNLHDIAAGLNPTSR
jgi:hypothetical protein